MTNLTATITFGVLRLALRVRAMQAHRQAKPGVEAGLLKMATGPFAASAVGLIVYFV